MLFHFRDKFPQLNPFWDKYLEYQERLEVPVNILIKDVLPAGIIQVLSRQQAGG